jgi:dATP pyrophosphohydrolase
MNIKTNLIEAHIIKRTKEGNKYLIMKRASNQKYPNIWQMVTGKINENEKAYETALREIEEETNLTISQLYIVPNVNYFYNNNDDSITIIPVFVAVIDNDKNLKISTEHSEYKWSSVNEAKQLFAWQGQKQSIDIIEDYFTGKNMNLFFEEIKLNL